MPLTSWLHRLRTGEIVLGSWVQIGHPAVPEILTAAGFAWLAMDMEHGEVTEDVLPNMIRSMRGRDCAPLVRVQTNDVLCIRRALDLGATGVIVPMVNSAAQAEAAVAAAKYPPRGVRGFAHQVANTWGRRFDEEMTEANELTAVITMVETQEAVSNIAEIASVPGVDAVLVGAYDLSGSFGYPGQVDHELVLRACRSVVTACSESGCAAGIHVVNSTPACIAGAIEMGYTLLGLGMDTTFVRTQADLAINDAVRTMTKCTK